MGAQRRQRGKPQHTGPHLRFSGRAGRRSTWFSLLPFCQTASAFRLIYLFHTFFRRGVYCAMVFAPLRCPKLFRFPFSCLRAAPSVRFAHHIKSLAVPRPKVNGPALCGTGWEAVPWAENPAGRKFSLPPCTAAYEKGAASAPYGGLPIDNNCCLNL